MPALAAQGIRKQFGRVVALDGADFTLDVGEVHALIGSNGCGKSTLCKIIAGAVGADEGDLLFDGRVVVFGSPADAAAAGIEMFYQDLSLIPAMTVAENIYLGREPKGRMGFVDVRTLRAWATAAIREFAAAFGASVDADATVMDLSADQRQIVEILKVLARDSRIIIFDEATAALDRDQVDAVFQHIRALKSGGRSIIFISHRMDEVFAIADRITVMRNGRTVMSSPVAQTTRDAVVMAMAGETQLAESPMTRHRPTSDPALAVAGLQAGKLGGVSFTLRRGEILGFGGLHGQGQSDLVRALYGDLPLRAGSIEIGAARYNPKGPAVALRHAMAYVSGDRVSKGVMAIRPVFENLVLSLLARDRRWVVARKPLEAAIAPIIAGLKLQTSSLEAPVSELSGGNQQKIVIGRALATTPSILLLDDPTKGIDLGTKADLYVTMDDLCARGVSILLYSSDDKELLTVCDRVLVFNGGRVTAELEGEERNEMALYRAAYSVERTNVRP